MASCKWVLVFRTHWVAWYLEAGHMQSTFFSLRVATIGLKGIQTGMFC